MLLSLNQFVTSLYSLVHIRLKSITRRPLFVKNNFRLETTGSRANVRHVANFRTLLSSAIVTDYHPLQTKLFTIPISLAALVLFECAVL